MLDPSDYEPITPAEAEREAARRGERKGVRRCKRVAELVLVEFVSAWPKAGPPLSREAAKKLVLDRLNAVIRDLERLEK